MLSVHCLFVLSCLSVTLVYCGQTVGWIKMKLDMEVHLGPSDIVSDGDPAPPSPKGQRPPIFGPCLLWPNGWIDQDATWYTGRPRPRRHCVRWGPSSPQKGAHSPPIFSACLLWPNGRPSRLLLSTFIWWFNKINVYITKWFTITILDTSVCSLKTVGFPTMINIYIHSQLVVIKQS